MTAATGNGGEISVINESGDPLVVTITSGSATPTAYTTSDLATTVATPATITTTTSFWFKDAGDYLVSVKHRGVEIARADGTTRVARLGGGNSLIFKPGLAQDRESAVNATLTQGVKAVTASGAAQTIPAGGVATLFDYTLTAASCTFTMPTATPGRSFTQVVRQDATGSRLAVWTDAVWAGGTEPTLETDAAAIDVVQFLCLPDGTWFGRLIGADVKP